MSQTADDPVPATCPPGLRQAWLELLKDGGISNVRRLMFRDVAETLAAEIRQDVDRLLDDFSAGLAARVAAEKKRLSMGSSELQAAVTCYNVVLQLRVGPRRVRVEVTDGNPKAATLANAQPDDTSGRGLFLVAVLARDWGVSDDGEMTWCVFDAPAGRS